MPAQDATISLAELSKELKRAEHTIRQWLRRPDFPKELKPELVGGRNKMMWKEEQVEGMRSYARERASARGWGGSARVA